MAIAVGQDQARTLEAGLQEEGSSVPLDRRGGAGVAG